MTKEQLKQWDMLRRQYINGYHMSDSDKRELISLNHVVMEQANRIHNDNMFDLI